VIKQDKLGLDVVCIQAKRWDGPVGRPIIQGFVGSMDYIRTKKGGHSHDLDIHEGRRGLRGTHRGQEGRSHLINGDQLAELMIDHGLGVTTPKTYEIREVSNDFFDGSDL
jgi:restriction system protein